MAGNGIVLTNCTKLLAPHSLQLRKQQYISPFVAARVSLRCKRGKSGLNCSELCQCDDCQNDKKGEFVKVLDQDIEEGYEYCTVSMKNTALKTFTMKLFTITIYI